MSFHNVFKRVVITGGAGFIGSHLVDYFLAKGLIVHVLDDLSNGIQENLPLKNEKLLFEQLDIGSGFDNPVAMDSLNQAVAAADFVFHLASPIGVQRAHSQRLDTTQRILKDGLCVVDACYRYRCPLLFTSSSEVYGQGDKQMLQENDTLKSGLQPRWGYGAAKLAVEHLVAGLYQELGINTWIVRLFNVVGVRQRPETGLVVPNFCKAALDGKPLIIHGDGSQHRNFVHVSDVVRGIILIIENESLCGQAVNLGWIEQVSVKELANRILTLHNCSSEIRFLPYAEVFGENFVPVLDRIPDLSLIQESTGWRPEHTLDEAIQDCLQSLQVKP